MSDLANSCEYLTSEKLCLAVSGSEKAKASRQIRCRNDEKTTCCYLCMFVLDCATPCQFLGNVGTDSSQIIAEKTKTESKSVSNEKTEVDEGKNDSVAFCTLCNLEMSKAKTKFRIDGWEGTQRKNATDKPGRLEEVLPVIVYVCPKCGKIEFRAYEKSNK